MPLASAPPLRDRGPDVTEDVRLALLHLHQRGASLDSRERLGARVAATARRREMATLATCHRVEIYAAIPSVADARAWVAERIGDDGALDEATCLVDADAARHLFRVAAGLDSAVVGEGQIAAQVRRTYDEARAQGIHPLLAALFQHALRVARDLRAGSPLGAVRRSVGSLAVDEALRHVDPATATALVIGAGEMGKLAARALARRVGTLVVANRDPARGREVAEAVGATAIGLEELGAALATADVVISAADTRGSILTRALLWPRCAARPLVLVDIAVPRSVAADARDLEGLRYRDVDHLGTDASLDPGVVAAAERRCAAEADRFLTAWRERAAAATIRELHERATALRRVHLARALAKLGHLDERDRRIVEGLATSVTSALIHAPTVALRRVPEHETAARALFGLDASSDEKRT